MKLIGIEKIGTLEIVRGIFNPTIDPEATKAQASPLIEALPEWAQLQSQKMKITAAEKEKRDKYTLASEARSRGDAVNAEKYTAEYQAALANIKLLERETIPIAEKFETERARIFLENPAYCNPGPEYILSENEAAAEVAVKLNALKEGELLKAVRKKGEISAADMKAMQDPRGAWWVRKDGKLEEIKIEAVDAEIPKGAVRELSDAERQEYQARRESERIAGLSSGEKTKEIEARITALKREAALKKQEAEIADEDFDAKAWYQEKKAEIEVKYA